MARSYSNIAQQKLRPENYMGIKCQSISLNFQELCDFTKNFESPVAGWCGIFRNITNFVTLRNGDYGHFQRVVEAMTIRSLSEQEIKEYFSDMMTLEDMEPYIEGGHELGYRKGLAEGLEKGEKEKVAFIKGLHKAGVSAEVIASAAGQSIDYIQKILKESE